MLPSIFGESLFDDWMDFPFRDFESDVDRRLYGKHASRVIKKDQIQLQLENGYLTVTAAKGLESDETTKKGKLVHQERYSGSMSRSFYVGSHVREEDVKAKFEDGVLTLHFPKAAAQQIPERRTIQIEG